MVRSARKIIRWAFEDNAGFFISEYSFSENEKKTTAYFVFKRYRTFGIPLKEQIKIFLEREKAQEYLNLIENRN